VKLLLENLPPSLVPQRETLRRCLEAMDRALPIEQVVLFGSHARGEAREDSDVDLCLVSTGAAEQMQAGNRFYQALWDIWPRPGFSLVPITPARLDEKRAIGDYFFDTVLKEGIPIAS
jgi:predicted nucleotidyltransferase